MSIPTENCPGEKRKAFLALVSTPIGNLSDITFRAVETLKQSDIVAAEDTRRAKILLDRYEIRVELISYHAHNEHRKTDEILELVLSGKNVSMLSDAGTPSISDPGYLICSRAIEKGISPLIIPGVSALTFAVTACGLPVDKFAFHGFLPVKQGRRMAALQKIASEDRTSFVFESPHRILKLINEISTVLGPETRIAIIREATKLYEEIMRGTAGDISEKEKNRSWKGECTVAIFKESPAKKRGNHFFDNFFKIGLF